MSIFSRPDRLCFGTAAEGVARVMLLVVVLGFLYGCADRRYASDYIHPTARSENMRIAVIPLENLTNYPNAGVIISRLVATEMYQIGGYQLMEGTALAAALKQNRIDVANLGNTMAAAELASTIEVDAVMIGSVSEYGYQHGLHEEPVVGINLRLVSVEDGTADGKVLWASSHSTTGRSYIQRDSVNAAAQRLVSEMLSSLNPRQGSP